MADGHEFAFALVFLKGLELGFRQFRGAVHEVEMSAIDAVLPDFLHVRVYFPLVNIKGGPTGPAAASVELGSQVGASPWG